MFLSCRPLRSSLIKRRSPWEPQKEADVVHRHSFTANFRTLSSRRERNTDRKTRTFIGELSQSSFFRGKSVIKVKEVESGSRKITHDGRPNSGLKGRKRNSKLVERKKAEADQQREKTREDEERKTKERQRGGSSERISGLKEEKGSRSRIEKKREKRIGGIKGRRVIRVISTKSQEATGSTKGQSFLRIT